MVREGYAWQGACAWQGGHAWGFIVCGGGGHAWQERWPTVADGTHPTGMHSCLSGEYFGYFQKLTSRIAPMKIDLEVRMVYDIVRKRTSCQLLNNFRVVLFAR